VVSNSDCFTRIPELHEIQYKRDGIGEQFTFDTLELRQWQEEYRLMRRLITVMAALTFSLALFMPLASAKTTARESVAQDQKEAEAAAYKLWYDANSAKDYPKAMELAKAYLEKFPAGQYAGYLKDKWIPQMQGYFFKQAADAKNVPEVIKIGKEVLARDPDNLDYLSALVVQIRSNELFSTPPNFAHAAEATDFAQHTIRLIEAGKTPSGSDPNVFKKNVTLAYMHQTLAVIYDHEKSVDKALAEYEKAGALEPTNPAYSFHCGRIHNDKYATAATNYEAAQKKVDAIPDADRNATDPKPDVKAALDESKAALADVNAQADAVITCWARFLGLTVDDKKWDIRPRIQQAFTELYKFRHNGSTDGMEKLIDQNRASPTSSTSNTASAATKP
jgi:tetratricopeptide (TPR) repeat protein